MNDTTSAQSREICRLRAVVLALAVMAQMFLPAIVLRADAAAGELCLTRTDGSNSGKSSAHRHAQQCAHCRLQDCASLTPPSAAAIVAESVGSADAPVKNAPWAPPPRHRAQPPPTGPPSIRRAY